MTAIRSSEHLRTLKQALRIQHPQVSSSHLGEAIAAALGFRTQSALIAAAGAGAPKSDALDASAFRARLADLGHPGVAPPDVGVLWPIARVRQYDMPSAYRDLIEELVDLGPVNATNQAAAMQLQEKAKLWFGQLTGIGEVDDASSDEPSLRACVDHRAASPEWSQKLDVMMEPFLTFAGSDHVVRYCQPLPLDGDRFVRYTTAVVSMPYLNADGSIREINRAREQARHAGWTVEILPDWSWYAPGSTSLVLFRRATTGIDLRRDWDRSFHRWAVTHARRLSRTKLIPETVDFLANCPYVPLDLVDYEDCRERYLKAVAPHLYADRDHVYSKQIAKLFEQWLADRTGA